MVVRLRLFSLFLSCFLIPLTYSRVFAIENPVFVKASIDKAKLSLDELVNFTIEISGNVKGEIKIELPDLKEDFEIVSTAQSQSFNIQGEEKFHQVDFIYVLAAKKAGKFTIGEVTVKIGKEIFKTQNIAVEVTPSAQPSGKKAQPQIENPQIAPDTIEPEEEPKQEEVIL